MAAALGVKREKMVLTWQTHTTNIRVVSEDDLGKGVVKERDYRDIDGLLTNMPGVTLVTFFADCVPLYFVDPKHRAIGLAHSGWRGTVNRMGEKMVAAMKREYGSRPESRKKIFPSLISARDAIRISCFPTGRWERSEGISARFLRSRRIRRVRMRGFAKNDI